MNIDISRGAVALLALAALAGTPHAAAAPLPFLAQDGAVLGGSVAGFDGDGVFDVAAPPAALSIEGDSLAVSSDGDMATALARAGAGALGTRLDLAGVAGIVLADTLATFAGDVLAGGAVTLLVDLESALVLDTLGALGFTELGYAVFAGGIALVDESVLLDGAHDRTTTFVHELAPAPGGVLSLEAFLFSSAEAGPGGFADGLASARFAFEPVAAASEPGATLLLATGLVLVAATRLGRGASG